MLDWLLAIDRALFVFINMTIASPVTDFIMPIVTNDYLLRVVYGLTLVLLLVFGRKKFIWVVVFSAIVVALSDQSASAWLKPLFGRLRPCKVMEVHLLVNCGAGLSFPSSHATNLFGQALFFGILYRKYAWYIVAFAALVGVSRVFVGVHYPLDVLAEQGVAAARDFMGGADVIDLRTVG